MQRPGSNVRPPPRVEARAASAAVYALSAAIAAVEVGRVPLTGGWPTVVLAIVAAGIVLPIHLWHLRFALRGARAPHAGATLLVMAVVDVAALVVVGVAWSLMLAMLAASALVVLRPPWSLLAVAACVASPAVVLTIGPPSGAFYANVWYLTYTVLFRSVVQFAIVWLAAAATQLVASRGALAAAAVDAERAAMRGRLRDALQVRLAQLGEDARAARDRARSAGPDPLARVTSLADGALTDLRKLVAAERRVDDAPAVAGLSRSLRALRSPVGRGLVTRQAWGSFVGVHTVLVGYLLLASLHTLNNPPIHLSGTVWFHLSCCLAAGGIQIAASLLVAQNRPPARPLLWLLATIVVVVIAQVSLDAPLEVLCWLLGSMALICLPGRWAVVGLAVSVIGYVAFDTVAYTIPFPGATTYLVVWNVVYGAVSMLLVDAGIVASARLVAIVAQLELTRDDLASRAAQEERRRMSRDLHDVLGQSLTAIALKGDLAVRLRERDPSAADREIRELATVAASLVAELDAVTRDERQVAFAVETESAVDLLRRTGTTVSTDVQVERLGPSSSVLLGWAVREGTTNILRHAEPRACVIRAAGTERLVQLEMINDGVTRRHDVAGTGLTALAERVARAGGRLETATLGRDSFRLYVEVPP